MNVFYPLRTTIMTLNLANKLELTVLEHMCEAYLYGALYSTDFCTLLI